MAEGIDTVRQILALRDPPATGSGLLDAVARTPFDKHDVRGCATLAREALAVIGTDDPARRCLETVAGTSCTDNRVARSYMVGIFAHCDQAVEAHEASLDASPAP